MTVFYQQSGRRGETDFHKTLVERNNTLRKFTLDTLRNDYSVSIPSADMRCVDGTSSFQIWGVPSGAESIFAKMKYGDLVLLIGHLSKHSLEDGKFFYAGKVVYLIPKADFLFSQKLWGDGGFPLIFFLQGALVEYRWIEFAKDFHFSPNYYIAGHIMRIPEPRMRRSTFGHDFAVASRLHVDDASIAESHR